jgi:hypothetical protein
MATRPQNGLGPFGANTGYPQQLMAVSTVHLHWGSMQMDLRPAQLRVDIEWQAAIGSERQVGQRKAVIAQEERRLVQPVLAPWIL